MPSRPRTQTLTKTDVGVSTKALVGALFALTASAFIAAPAVIGNGAVDRQPIVLPELAIQNVTVSRPLANNRREVSFEIVNNGGRTNVRIPVVLYTVTPNNTQRAVFASSVNGGLAQGEVRRFTTSFVYANSFKIRVDKDNAIFESNENNNIFTRVTDLYADVAIENVQTRTLQGRQREISFEVVNRGNVDVTNSFGVSLRKQIGMNRFEEVLGQTIDSLPIGERRNFRYTGEVSSIKITTLVSALTAELNRENNEVTRVLDPDLTIRLMDVSGNGDVKNVRVEVRNNSTVNMPRPVTLTTFRIFGDREQRERGDLVIGLRAGESQIFTYCVSRMFMDALNVQRADAFKVEVDRENEVVEVYEDNNSQTFPFLERRD